MHSLAILGPRSNRRHLAEAEAEAQRLGWQLQNLESPDTTQVEEFLHKEKPECVLIFGGDGTLNRWLGTMVAAKVPVLPIPSGSGNDFAMVNGIPDAKTALKIWRMAGTAQMQIVATDLGTLKLSDGSLRYFSCCANVGLDADAAARTNVLPNWLKQRKGYFIGGIGAIIKYQPLRLKITGEGFQPIDELSWFISICNTPIFGGGLPIAPQASITDGMLDIVFVGSTEIRRRDLVRHYPKILSGKHTEVKEIKMLRTTQLRIETEISQPIYADGEFIGHTPVDIAVAPACLRVMRMADR